MLILSIALKNGHKFLTSLMEPTIKIKTLDLKRVN